MTALSILVWAALQAAKALPTEAPKPPSPRPVVQVPADLSSEYFRQAYAIEHATRRQEKTIAAMKTFCTENVATVQQARDSDGEITFVCVPKEEKSK